jgi:2-methylcitrate dehydratase PrpD
MPDSTRPGLAARVVDLALSSPVGAAELGQARLAVLDTVAVALAGGDEPAPRLVRRAIAPAATGPTMWHGQVRTGLNDAALANAVAAHALDYDCLIPAAFVQPGAVLIPALIAVAERDGRSGAALEDAVCRGVAVLGALGNAFGGDLHTAGWHPTTVLGVVATAVATSCLLELDRAEIVTAVNIAVATSGGLKASFGTMTKELQVGEAARSGVWAAVLAADGMSAAETAADSWLRLVTGEAAATTDLPQRATALHLKRYPCCGRMHAALDLAAAIRADLAGGPPPADDIREIACVLNPRDISHIDRATVNSAAEAKFSVQYGLAATLLRGPLGLADFDVVGHPDPDVFALMGRVQIAADTQVPSFGAEIAITSRSGSVVRQRASAPTAAAPADVASKFIDCVQWAGLAVEDAERFTDLVTSLDDLGDVRDLIRSLPATAGTGATDHRSPLEGITS